MIRRIALLFALTIVGFTPAAIAQADSASHVGREIADFNLRNVDGTWLSFKNYREARGFLVVFTCNHCPFAKLYTSRFNDLHRKYSGLGVPLIAINPMDSLIYADESFDEMRSYASAEGYVFPYLQDATQQVAREFNVEHTPQAFVVWKSDGRWIIRYSGAVDDDGEHPDKANDWVGSAVDQLLKGEPVNPSETDSFGCRVFYRSQR